MTRIQELEDYICNELRDLKIDKAELEQQLERQKNQLADYAETNIVHRQQLAAAQARIAELRDALQTLLKKFDWPKSHSGREWDRGNAATLLDTTDNLDALKQYRDKVIDECAKASGVEDDYYILQLKEKPL